MPNRSLKFGVLVATLVGIFAASQCGRFDTSQKPTTAKAPAALTRDSPPPPQSTDHEAKMLSADLKKKPGHVPILLRLAKIASDSGRPKEAIQRLKEVVQQEPKNVEARLDLGKLLFESGDVRAAIEQNEMITKVKPDDPDALYNLGAIYGNIGNAQRAEQYWDRLLAANPESESGRRASRMLALLKKDAGTKN